jgi:hypothetical protein
LHSSSQALSTDAGDDVLDDLAQRDGWNGTNPAESLPFDVHNLM